MAILGIKVPEEVAAQLELLEAPGERVPMCEKHITLLYLGDHLPIEVLAQALVACARLTEKFSPFEIALSEVTTFPANEHGYPVICPVMGQGIHALHSALVDSCEHEHVEYSKRFPTYKPHVTLSFSPYNVLGEIFEPIIWTCKDMVLWGGDEGDHRMATTFEFMSGCST